MIKTKYVVGDVVVVNGKQKVIDFVRANQYSLYGEPFVIYTFTDGSNIDEEELDASN